MEMESHYNARNPRLTESLERLREETSKDTTLNTLHKVIVNGWPADRTDIPESLHPCWNYGNELSVKNGIYKGAKVMLPQSMQKDMLCNIHAKHFGGESKICMAAQDVVDKVKRKIEVVKSKNFPKYC
ncbi:unnamed protein product [Porites evermanni]|uniref:Uncharacterized protein n=1 Tax=Porites evermanni TaxID=104178 RepID=A0ABN8S0Z7_9CNID|nr:unnamed protein product [Porites evermanni]